MKFKEIMTSEIYKVKELSEGALAKMTTAQLISYSQAKLLKYVVIKNIKEGKQFSIVGNPNGKSIEHITAKMLEPCDIKVNVLNINHDNTVTLRYGGKFGFNNTTFKWHVTEGIISCGNFYSRVSCLQDFDLELGIELAFHRHYNNKIEEFKLLLKHNILKTTKDYYTLNEVKFYHTKKKTIMNFMLDKIITKSINEYDKYYNSPKYLIVHHTDVLDNSKTSIEKIPLDNMEQIDIFIKHLEKYCHFIK